MDLVWVGSNRDRLFAQQQAPLFPVADSAHVAVEMREVERGDYSGAVRHIATAIEVLAEAQLRTKLQEPGLIDQQIRDRLFSTARDELPNTKVRSLVQ